MNGANRWSGYESVSLCFVDLCFTRRTGVSQQRNLPYPIYSVCVRSILDEGWARFKVKAIVTIPIPRARFSPSATEVQLLDGSRTDAPAEIFASYMPIPSTLSYDPAQIAPHSTYVLAVRVTVDRQLRWSNTERYAVLTCVEKMH